jgi:Zn finger protein HypA/HybF involved in hydrogenase expression
MRCPWPKACARSSRTPPAPTAPTRVLAVRLEIGKLAQVEPEAMRFAFDVVKRGSLADQASLEIVETDGTAWCMPAARRSPSRPAR